MPYFCRARAVGRVPHQTSCSAMTFNKYRFLNFAGLAISLALVFSLAPFANAQTPLDMRVMSERLNQLERRLQSLQSAPASIVQSRTTPENAGTSNQAIPTDVASRLQVRVLQLERLLETLTGQIEETRFEVSRMRSELQQMSNDVSYRLAVLEQVAGISSAVAAPAGSPISAQIPSAANQSPNATSVIQSGGSIAVQGSAVAIAEASRLNPDLNMPMSAPVQTQPMAQIVAPGVPASVTTQVAPGTVQTAPIEPGPVNQGNTFGVLRTDSSGAVLPAAPGAVSAPVVPAQQDLLSAPPNIQPAPTPGPVAAARIGTAPDPTSEFMTLPDGSPKEQYDYAFDILRQADYARAEKALRMFLDANASDDLAGNAQYWLGETYYVRGDFEQAAVEFLSGYQTYPASTKGPDNLLKLGLSMARLGQTDGACTALTRLATEYPSANDTIRRRAQTERARLKCS